MDAFGSAGVPFEYTITQKKNAALIAKRVSLILFYIFWTVGLLLLGFSFGLVVPLLALIPFSLWLWVFLTWRLTQVEYEYSYFAGKLTVSRILGGRSRRVLCEITLRHLVSIRPCTEDAIARAERFGAKKPILAASSTDSPNLYVALWEEDGIRGVLYLEPTEKALKIIKMYNMSATLH